jgi:hypothetical protein
MDCFVDSSRRSRPSAVVGQLVTKGYHLTPYFARLAMRLEFAVSGQRKSGRRNTEAYRIDTVAALHLGHR